MLTMMQTGVSCTYGYNHEDLSTLPYQQQTGIVTQAVQVYQHVSAEPEVTQLAIIASMLIPLRPATGGTFLGHHLSWYG